MPGTRLHAGTLAGRERMDDAWWRRAVVYQVYPRSFADSNGDGIGDLPGVTSRVGYLQALGVDAVWLSPFYPSGWADGGYDVVDYRNVDPRLGTLADFDAMVAALHERGIRVIIDIVPNHSSDRHPWFVEAVAAGRGSAARARYIFRDGSGPDGANPPNDWPSHFGSSAWTRVPDGQWYLHLFAPQQPDFNWDCPDVRADFEQTLRFWSDRGVDGFRIDVAHGLAKDLSEPYPSIDGFAIQATLDGSHPLVDRNELVDIYGPWSRLLRSYDPPRMTVAEASVAPERLHRYTTVAGLDQAFNFAFLEIPWEADAYRAAIVGELETATRSGSSSTWVLGNHDCVRPASRLAVAGDVRTVKKWLLDGGPMTPAQRSQGLLRARAAMMLLMALPGSTYIYQGDELGLFEVAELPPRVLQDPIWSRSGHQEKGRDGCRVPLPWSRQGTGFGFGGAPHLPQPRWFGAFSVEAQESVPESTLTFYRQMIAARRQLAEQPGFRWLPGPDGTLQFQRGEFVVLANLGVRPVELPLGEVVLASGPVRGRILPPDMTVWLRSAVPTSPASPTVR